MMTKVHFLFTHFSKSFQQNYYFFHRADYQLNIFSLSASFFYSYNSNAKIQFLFLQNAVFEKKISFFLLPLHMLLYFFNRTVVIKTLILETKPLPK